MNASPDLPDDVQPPDLTRASILIVDDNLQNLELMQAYLEELGCSIATATDGLEAIEAIDRAKPDLLLLDVMMPRMSGFEVCQKIKAQPTTSDIVIIMVTALNEVGDFERAVDCGTDDYIAKPVNKLELLTKVQSLLEHRLLMRSCDQLGLQEHVPTPDFGMLTDEGDTILPPPDEDEFDGEAPRAPKF